MKLHISKILLPLTACGALILSLGSCSSDSNNAREAYEQAEKGNMAEAIEKADLAYKDYQKLDTEDLCRLAATYAAAALTNGDASTAQKFQTCYKASMERDSAEAEEIYRSFDPQMADALALISGLLDGDSNFSPVAPSGPQAGAETEGEEISSDDSEGVAED